MKEILSRTIILLICCLCVLFAVLQLQFQNFNKILESHINKYIKLSPKQSSNGCLYIEKISKKIGIKSCFKKSLSKRILLNLAGYQTKMFIGVSSENTFSSHSWLHSDGINTYEKPDKNMKVIKIFNNG